VGDQDTIWTRPSGLVIRRVSGTVYRSAQPKKLEDWEFLRDVLLVDKVVKLNTEDEFAENGARAMGIMVVDCPIPMLDDNIMDMAAALFEKPSHAVVERALDVMENGRCLVHCQHGQDRTGLLCAMYRVQHDSWSTLQAWEEALQFGYHPEFMGLDRAWFEDNAAGPSP
jgi:protein tyrosine/serine phosphatase